MVAVEPTDEVILHTVAELTARSVVTSSPVLGRGYSGVRRLLVTFDDGRRAFVKAAVDLRTSRKLRAELVIYSQVQATFLPQVLGWRESELPVLLLEDLTDAVWPPPWSSENIELVLAAVGQINATPPPSGLPRLEEQREVFCGGWSEVATDPAPFLRVGLCSASWFDEALPTLIAATDAAVLDGEALLHLDVRSDNVCLRDGRAIIFDWDFASIGNPAADLACWLPSLHMEGGPAPEELLPDGGPLAASVSGYFASRVGLPAASAREERRNEIYLFQLKGALPWAVRALGLAPLA